MSLVARRSAECRDRQGSFRIEPAELRGIGLARAAVFAVPANTLVVADTFGFHARGPSARPSLRVEIWAYGRRSPFVPWAALVPWTGAALARRSLIGWQIGDLFERAGIKPHRWRLRTGNRCSSRRLRSCLNPFRETRIDGVGPRPIPEIRRAAAAAGARPVAADRRRGAEIVYDLGAGAGNVTRLIAARWPEARVVGVDGSAEMLAKAAAENPAIEWQQADLATWRPSRPADVIYSNAALHWLDGPRASCCPRCSTASRRAASLAVQMPRNFGAPSHTSIAEAALTGPGARTLEPLLRPSPVAEPDFYYDLLAPRAAALDIWETEYLQVLDGAQPGQGMDQGRPGSAAARALDEPERSRFEDGLWRAGRGRLSAPRRTARRCSRSAACS